MTDTASNSLIENTQETQEHVASVTLLKATSKAALTLSFNLFKPHKSSGTNSKGKRALKISEAAAITWHYYYF